MVVRRPDGRAATPSSVPRSGPCSSTAPTRSCGTSPRLPASPRARCSTTSPTCRRCCSRPTARAWSGSTTSGSPPWPRIDDPVEKLVVTVRTGLPVDRQDASVRLLCELGGAAGPAAGVRRAADGALRPSGGDVPGDPGVRHRPRRVRAAHDSAPSPATWSPSRTPTATGSSPATPASTTTPRPS